MASTLLPSMTKFHASIETCSSMQTLFAFIVVTTQIFRIGPFHLLMLLIIKNLWLLQVVNICFQFCSDEPFPHISFNVSIFVNTPYSDLYVSAGCNVCLRISETELKPQICIFHLWSSFKFLYKLGLDIDLSIYKFMP